MTAPALSRLAEDQPPQWPADTPAARYQPVCHIPWCADDTTGVHASRLGEVTLLGVGTPRVGVMLIATGDRPPDLYVGTDLALTVWQATHMAALLSKLGHYELAGLVTSTAALAGGTP